MSGHVQFKCVWLICVAMCTSIPNRISLAIVIARERSDRSNLLH